MLKTIVFSAALATAAAAQATVYHFASNMTAAQEAHNPASPAFGSTGFTIDSTTGRIFGSFTARNLVNGPASITDYHIHEGPLGVAGAIRVWNNQAGNTILTSTSGTETVWNSTFDLLLTQRSGTTGVLFNYDGDAATGVDLDDVNTLLGILSAGGAYTNVHTTFSGAGEIRGQVGQTVPEPAALSLLALTAATLLPRRRRR